MTANAGASLTVTLDYATIVPIGGNSSIGFFKSQNIHFAAVLTSSLRFEKPQWPKVQNETIDGTAVNALVARDSDEDFLYMDI